MGWNAQSGFDLTGEDESLKPFLQKAGVSENQLKDRRTRDFIYDFIQNHNVAEVVKKEKTQKTTPPPPVPSRHQVILKIIIAKLLDLMNILFNFRIKIINQVIIIKIANKDKDWPLHRPQ